jgi:predicted permease
VTQIALSLALLVSCGLLLRTLQNMNTADRGFEQDHLLTASVGLGIAGYPPSEGNAIQHKILDRIRALPGVKVAALTDWLPLNLNGRSVDVYPEGYVPRSHESHEVRRAGVTPGFFTAMGIPIVAGRDFSHDDNEAAPRVVIVDQTAAAHYWPGVDPLGRRLSIGGSLFTVIGVARNSKHQFINEPAEPMVYLSFFQSSNATIVMLRTHGDPAAMAPVVEDTIHQVSGQAPVFDVRSLRETTQVSSAFAVMESTVAGVFAIIALALAVTGIYGVVAYRTRLRTREIGIRVALGASRSAVLRLVLYSGLRLAVAGLVLGVLLALGFTRFMASLLYGVSATDPLTMVCMTALLAIAAMLACCLPALRATRVDPVDAIRTL